MTDAPSFADRLCDVIVATRPCPRRECSAPVGDWCRTKTGNKASFLHGARGADLWDTYREGLTLWVEGREDPVTEAYTIGLEAGRYYYGTRDRG